MKLTLSILAASFLISGFVGPAVLIAGSAAAAQNDAEKTSVVHADAATKATRPAYQQELDKIDDVNPFVIKGIIIDGCKLISRSQIKAVIKTKPGDFYHRKDIEQDLKAVYNLGYFEPKDFHVESQTTAAGMVITIHVKENPLFKSITFSGNHVVPTEKLQDLFKPQLQKPQSNTQMADSVKAIEDLYKTQGYLLAHTTVDREDPAGNVTVTIDEGIVKEIKIACLNDEQKSLVQNALTLKVGEPYNEKQLAADLKTAFKSGKFDNLSRDILPVKGKSDGYILSIKSTAKSQETKSKVSEAPLKLLSPTKSKSSLPVLNRLIHSPMYKNIK